MLTPFSPAERAIRAEEISGPSAASAVSSPTRGSDRPILGPTWSRRSANRAAAARVTATERPKSGTARAGLMGSLLCGRRTDRRPAFPAHPAEQAICWRAARRSLSSAHGPAPDRSVCRRGESGLRRLGGRACGAAAALLCAGHPRRWRDDGDAAARPPRHRGPGRATRAGSTRLSWAGAPTSTRRARVPRLTRRPSGAIPIGTGSRSRWPGRRSSEGCRCSASAVGCRSSTSPAAGRSISTCPTGSATSATGRCRVHGPSMTCASSRIP